MFVVDGQLHWSASDLTAAATCEYALLRRLDQTLGLTEKAEAEHDPFQEHIARLGDAHEARLLDGFTGRVRVTMLDRIQPPYTSEKIAAARKATIAALAAGPEIIHQAAFHDGEFFGYADFVERAHDGWRVCDAKLARSAKPQALIQLGAYADQVRRLGLPLSSTVSLLLGNGERADFRVDDVLPVFLERRARLRRLLDEHRREGVGVVWGDDRYAACGHCPECEAAATAANDIGLVAGLRTDQRRTLRAAGITTIGELATAAAKPDSLAQATFDKLQGQARMQWAQLQSGGAVAYELTSAAPSMLGLLPAPSPGDLFFDFEGDPLHDEDDPSRLGLEYLWGVLDASGKYTPTWAHSSAEERAAFVAFIDDVMARRAMHPDLHVYHYAPYETSALKRLAMRYQTREEELDDLLRSEVFVDLYATVRGSVRVSQPSYSIKKLEPLYMGDQLREGDVADGAGSIVAYREFRDLRDEDPAAAAERLTALADYNEYDCLSTLRLRDWLLDRADEAGVRHQIIPRIKDGHVEELSEQNPLFTALVDRSGPQQRSKRTAEEQAYAMLATSLDYYRREHKQFWWQHFERLGNPVDDWAEARDVFIVESAEVEQDWAVPAGRARNHRRTVRLVGDWTAGSAVSCQARVVYACPAPPGSNGPDCAPYAAAGAAGVVADPDDPRVVLLTESRKEAEVFADLPCALVPAPPPATTNIETAIAEVAAQAAEAAGLPRTAALDLLARRVPRLREGRIFTGGKAGVDSVVSSLVAMDDSYVAIQGPPGTGKTYIGSRVIRDLVVEHHWRIGVVAQSHAVVEHMLGCVVAAGLDRTLVAKAKTQSGNPLWTALEKVAPFLDEHRGTGCVIGGTAWDFANAKTVPRGSLDLLVVDEAGQFSLAPTVGASVSAKRLLLLGDPQQLPQVSQGTHAEPVDESALGWLMEGHETIPPDRGYFLDRSYRMHPALCSRVSTLSYDRRLHAAPAAGQRRLDGVAPGVHVVSLPHVGNRTQSPEEAAAVVDQVTRHVGLRWSDPDDTSTPRTLRASDLLVVAPYNAQVILIRAALTAAGLGDVRVGTVDRFQGQEAPVAIVSMTASSHGDVPRGMGFLLSRNRTNVAVSRAQWRAIVVRSPALTAYLPSTAEGVLELGSFIGLCRPDPAENVET